jgi:hypothetical protein
VCCPDWFRRLGIDARLAWHGDHDSDALVLTVLIEPDPKNLRRLQMWDGSGDGGEVAPVAGFRAAE